MLTFLVDSNKYVDLTVAYLRFDQVSFRDIIIYLCILVWKSESLQ